MSPGFLGSGNGRKVEVRWKVTGEVLRTLQTVPSYLNAPPLIIH